MAYMAVGSRQILFADTPTPASVRDDVASVASLSDNPGAQSAPVSQREGPPPAESSTPPVESPDMGATVDVRA